MPLEPLVIDEPTLAMNFTVNTSPLAGRDGQWVTSRDLRARLQKELLTNVSLRITDSETTDVFRVLARGELQLAILIETMRREGYELMVGKPEIVVREENGKKLEPLERLVVDSPGSVCRSRDGVAGPPPWRTRQDGQSRLRLGAHGVYRSLARADRLARAVAHRHARHRAALRLV